MASTPRVFVTRSLPGDEPLARAPRLLVAPHLGSATERTRERMASLAGERPRRLVNPEAWEGRR